VESTLANGFPRLDLSLTVILFPTEAVHNLGQSATKQSVSVPNRRAGFSNAIRLTQIFLTPRRNGSPDNNGPTTPTTQRLPVRK
jgi:hypothetical protein